MSTDSRCEQNINLLSDNCDGISVNYIVELKDKANDFINDKPTVIFFHGNSGNIGNRLGFISSYVQKLNVNILIGKLYGCRFI